jgi:hypothetical protein
LAQIANSTAAIVRGELSGLIALAGDRTGIVVTDKGGPERIGGGNARRPTSRNRRKNLHRKGNQDDRKKLPQLAAHRSTSSIARTNHAADGVSRRALAGLLSHGEFRRPKLRLMA